MENSIIGTFMRDALWLLVIAGWIFLVATGLEADKPLSGGIPGHVDPHEDKLASPEGRLDRLGVISAWVVFGLVSAMLPVILWWIFAIHPR
jgi:hypothetical protein